RQFPLPRSDAVVPVPQDALLWTYRSPEVDGGVPSSELSTRTAVCHSCMQSRCAGLPRGCITLISAKRCYFDTASPGAVITSKGWLRTGVPRFRGRKGCVGRVLPFDAACR